MDIDQKVADVAQQRSCDRAAVDPSHRAAIGAHLARQDDFVGLVAFERVFGQHRGKPGSHGSAETECTFDLGPVRPRADDLLRRPVTEQEVDGIDDDRLARAGLTGQDVEARSESEIQAVDDRQVAYAKFSQHVCISLASPHLWGEDDHAKRKGQGYERAQGNRPA